MRYTRHLASLALAAGMWFAGAPVVSARDWRDGYVDHGRVERLRAGIARDRARLDRDLRCRRYDLARRDRAELERDERALDGSGRRW